MKTMFAPATLRLHLLFIVAVAVTQTLAFFILRAAHFPFENASAVVMDMLLFIICIYAGRWLCAAFYLKRRYIRFAVATLIACIAISLIKWTSIRTIANHPNAGYLEAIRNTVPFFWLGLFLGIAIKLSRAMLQKEAAEARIKAEQKESELRLLQSQLSPHFLFNVLNNLYGISIEAHERLPGLLLKLSQLLRYSVYGGRNTLVPLKDELNYIRNYIEFEEIRMSDRLILDLQLEDPVDANTMIAPLILIVFVENAFKHARNNLDQRIYVSVSLKVANGFILFRSENSYDEQAPEIPALAGENPQISQSLPEDTGLGLTNTTQRLDLLYGEDYDLKTRAEKDRYFAELKLKTR